MKKIILSFFCFLLAFVSRADNGYDLWLRYVRVTDAALLRSYRNAIGRTTVIGTSPTMQAVQKELATALGGLIGPMTPSSGSNGILAGTPDGSEAIRNAGIRHLLDSTGDEGFVIVTRSIAGKKTILITGNTERGVLYGTFHFLRRLQQNLPVYAADEVSVPRIQLRMLNHWDNPDGSVERGYSGSSIWNWHLLPGYMDPRYTDYARANASIGINATVLTNVNANTIFLTPAYLLKVKALADLFRIYGIRVYLTAKFSSPIELGKLKTADPADKSVQDWWKSKMQEIYSVIPDFGGFLIKANSEGQPGPQDYGRTHADGANMLAEAIAPFMGTIIWRAFVYSHSNPADRHSQAYNDFVPLDGKFRSNVIVQVKNGAIDFMPREPFHPIFGAMPETPLAMEFQVTQEYLGQATNLVFLAPLFKETLDSDTYSKGKGSTVGKIIDGSTDHHTRSAMAGVANIGSDINWTGHPFAQSNWYALGRLAWDHTLSSSQVAREWLGMTFTNDTGFLKVALPLMLNSRDVLVQYSNPLGLHHIMGTGHHYGPAPWVSNQSRPEWNPVYYHKADSLGIGFDRTASGSNALEQYRPEVRNNWQDPETCDERLLLWFHHVRWDHRMKSGRTLWEELCYQYNNGCVEVKKMQETWKKLQGFVDPQRFSQVTMLLAIQYEEAVWWRNACLLYFRDFSGMPVPPGYDKPDHSLDYYKSLRFPFAPGN
ncbi:MAG: alpha-glucuronidase [Chitinophagaceae bacterium]|nr:MAG: alpha-glucuronidase [Chitinophagaceae bacterium]